ERHIVLGEAVKEESEVFVVADLVTVWVDISVYPKDLSSIRAGQDVVIKVGDDVPDVTGKIAYVGPVLGETTRTALARMILQNPDRKLLPGMFITAKVAANTVQVPVAVPKTALQSVAGKTAVFVRTAEGFEPRPVEVGRTSETAVEIVSGLEAGEHYVGTGAFTLKAQLSKGAFGDDHDH
ncbi:MAG TPA: efflux transporter periplasmic adaptor subunit, partial [Nitrospiraceae bacterium]|nr:efflux transporter periplasmic adaptor subunit [Nitrospiraceae bacterium]